MIQAPLEVYRIDMKYIRNLHNIDDRVLSVSPQIGKDERPVMNAWAEKFPQVVNASAQLHGISEELILMSHLSVMVSMDSGNMHLASIVNTPVVSIWGATHPYAGFMGWHQSPENAVQLDMPCRPCSIYGNKPCMRGDFACMKNISPEMVVEKVDRILKKR